MGCTRLLHGPLTECDRRLVADFCCLYSTTKRPIFWALDFPFRSSMRRPTAASTYQFLKTLSQCEELLLNRSNFGSACRFLGAFQLEDSSLQLAAFLSHHGRQIGTARSRGKLI